MESLDELKRRSKILEARKRWADAMGIVFHPGYDMASEDVLEHIISMPYSPIPQGPVGDQYFLKEGALLKAAKNVLELIRTHQIEVYAVPQVEDHVNTIGRKLTGEEQESIVSVSQYFVSPADGEPRAHFSLVSGDGKTRWVQAKVDSRRVFSKWPMPEKPNSN